MYDELSEILRHVDQRYILLLYNRLGLGFYPRLKKRNFIAAQCLYVEDATTLEAAVMRNGLVLSNSLGFLHMEEGSESMEVINFCTVQARCWHTSDAIFAECVDMVTTIGSSSLNIVIAANAAAGS